MLPEVMVHPKADPYLVLGVAPTASQAEITHAYRTRLRAHHPDTRHTPTSQRSDEDLRQVLAAYAVLRDPARRAEYDRTSSPRNERHTHHVSATTPAHRPAAARVEIPITHRHTTNTATAHDSAPPLQAGPVRRHRQL